MNKWEAGKTRGNECLIDLPISLKSLLFNNQEKVIFADKREENKKFKLTYTDRDWIRIPKKYYDKYNIQGGDEIILEKRILDDGTDEYFLDYLKNDNIVFQKKSFYDEEIDDTFDAFECLNNDLNSLDEKYGNHISIIYKGEFLRQKPKKPNKRYCYSCFDIEIDGKSILGKYGNTEMIEIKFYNNAWHVNLINVIVVCEMEV